jgi:membrane protease YdiL (CAAX protease family)
MEAAGALRLLIAGLLAFAGAWWVDRRTEAVGVLPPGFRQPWRRVAAMVVVASILFLGVFLPIALFGVDKPVPTAEDVAGPGIFLLQGLLVLSLVTWFVLGYAGVPELRLGSTFARQFGLRAEKPWKELGLGVLLGFGGWALVIGLMVAVAGIVYAVGGEESLPQAPPDLVPLVAGLPLLVRIAIGMTAGIVEETFFRGFLQPRVGIALSTIFFVMAHLSYDAPFMLVGITALSLLYAFVVRWRRNVLAAIVAHATFDLIQLLIVVPSVLRMLSEAAG